MEAGRSQVAGSAAVPVEAGRLRAQGADCARRGDHAGAVIALRKALSMQPDDGDLLAELADALRGTDDLQGAIAVCRAATERAPKAKAAWYQLARAFVSGVQADAAKRAFERALTLDPDYAQARGGLGDLLRSLGDIDGAVACYRACLRDHGYAPRAWFQLANLKTEPLTTQDVVALRSLHDDHRLRDGDRVFVGFALARALEDQQLYRTAFSTLVATNQIARRHAQWDANAFSRTIAAIDAAFKQPLATAAPAAQGREVIFLVSMPRSGSTLVAQIVSAHPQVDGNGGELPDLEAVLIAESNRRRRAFPEWVAQATPDDWRRLGEDYLARTARWHHDKPRFTDKALANWPLVGAAAAMLPGARFIDCRRDRLETCLACFRQLFAFGTYYSYDLDELASYWHDYDHLLRAWHARLPDRLLELTHEELLRDQEGQTRRLLDFLDLPFDPACLEFHRSDRQVRTFSAAQVRQPLQADTARAHRYGAALQPLREALARAGSQRQSR